MYEAALIVEGHSRDVLMDEQGRIVEVEEEVPLSALSPAVREGLGKAAGSGHIAKVESLTKGASSSLTRPPFATGARSPKSRSVRTGSRSRIHSKARRARWDRTLPPTATPAASAVWRREPAEGLALESGLTVSSSPASHWPAPRRTGRACLQLAEAYGSTMALVNILKPTVNRTRPNGGHYSFPTGHSASAFAGGAFLQMRYGWAYGAPAYALATYVAWSRVHAKQHYTTDVLAGGAIGIAANLVFTRRYGKVPIQPMLGPQAIGLTLEAHW